jgi:hypothetical protein
MKKMTGDTSGQVRSRITRSNRLSLWGALVALIFAGGAFAQPNVPPVITGQATALSTPEDTALGITLNAVTVVDPDDTFPTGFTLTVQNGTNYTHAGNTITPAANFNGTLAVPVTVNDGTDNSNVFNLSVTVTAVNDAPTITGQAAALSTPEETSLGITLSAVAVTDPDNAFPTGFTLAVQNGANYSRAGNTITPAGGFNGTLTVPVTVNDGAATSNVFNLSVTVTAVNDPPTITGQAAALSTPEETSLSITLNAVTVTDPDNTFPTGFTLAVQNGTNYTRSGNTITPAANFTGTLSVPVTVNDGTSNSNVFNLSVTVTAINDAPTITGQAGALSTPENTALTITLSAVNVTDPDNTFPTGFTLSVQNGTNYTRSGNTITPATNFNGALTVPVTVNDGSANSNVFNLSVTVTSVNDPPTITGQATPLSTPEDTALTITLSALTVTDPDNTYPTGFTLSVQNGTNYTRSGNTITPAANFTGTLTVPVTVNDGTANSNVFNLSVTVNSVNDPPTITGQATALSTPEKTALTITLSAVTVTDPDNTFPTGFTLSVQNGTNYTHSGNTITPAANFNGTLAVPVTVNDGTSNSNVFNLSVTVTAVNDPPTITGQATPLSTPEDTALTIPFSGLTVTDPDNTYPTGFTLAVRDGTNYTRSGNTITPAANFTGTLTVPVTVNDGTVDSNVFNLSVTVTAVNDSPTITGQATPLSTPEDTALAITLSAVTVTDPDNTFPTGFALTVQNGANYTHAGNTITPAANFNGTLAVPVTVSDGTSNSNVFNLSVTVTPVNDAPAFTSTPITTVNEDTSYTYAVRATDVDGNTVTLAAPTKPAWLTLTAGGSNGTATLSGTPGQAQVGVHNVTLTASDGIAPAVQQSFQITVVAVDDAPVITAIPDQTATEAVPYSLDLATFVTDEDTPKAALIFTATSPLPAGLLLAPTGILSGVPLPAGIGEYPAITFTVRDAKSTVSNNPPFKLNVLRAGRADLDLEVAVSPNPVALNAPATWTFTIHNNAPNVAVGSVSLESVFGGEVPVQVDPSATPGCAVTAAGAETRLTCTVGPVAGGSSIAVAVTSRGGFAGDVLARAKVSIPTPVPIDETPSNDTATGSLSVAQRISAAPAQRIVGVTGTGVAAGDLDADGFADLAIASPVAGTILLLNVVDAANADKRALTEAPLTLSPSAATGIAMADLDGDTDLDIVSTAGAGVSKQLFLNSGAATFTASPIGGAADNGRAVGVADVNGDLLPDIVFANTGASKVYTQGASLSFTQAATLGTADSRGLAAVDLFGDPLPEIVLANADGNATIYGNSGGTFTLALTLATGPTSSVAAADFNGDGRMDLVFGRDTATAPAAPSDAVWLNTSGGAAGSFFMAAQLGASPTAAVATADVDLDGDNDILVVNRTGAHQVYGNAGGGTFSLHPQQLAEPGAGAASFGRFGNDSRIDVALVGQSATAVYYNDGLGNLGLGDTTPPTIQLVGSATVDVTAGETYTDAGATAMDAADGDMTSRIKVDNPVNASVIGTYTVTYRVTDLSGNAATPATRTVRVQAGGGTGGGGGGALGLEAALLLACAVVAARLERGARRAGVRSLTARSARGPRPRRAT